MNLLEEIKKYKPLNEQEKNDKEQMIEFIKNNDNYLLRENKLAHFTVSTWTVNKERTKILMVYHKIYDSWSWIGGHADGIEDLKEVALRELEEETGVKNARLVSDDILSLETLNVNGHMRRGEYVPSHLHFNITYLAEADEKEKLVVNEMENKGVKWFTFEDALKVPHEPWFVEMIYKKLIERSK
ncbi:MAG: NUDIX hydrolase [Anaeroplasmataceae bacterium]|nr:NUDIX hydrolase [Anaeroplasmataceae bacterium]